MAYLSSKGHIWDENSSLWKVRHEFGGWTGAQELINALQSFQRAQFNKKSFRIGSQIGVHTKSFVGELLTGAQIKTLSAFTGSQSVSEAINVEAQKSLLRLTGTGWDLPKLTEAYLKKKCEPSELSRQTQSLNIFKSNVRAHQTNRGLLVKLIMTH